MKKVAKPTAKRKVARKAPRRPVASGMGQVLGQLQRYRRQLADQRADLDSRIVAIDGALAALGGGAPTSKAGPTRRRAAATGPRPGSLKAYIERVLRGRVRPLAVKDVTVAVRKAGYKSRDRTLAHSVGTALREMPSAKKVARGQYRLR